MIEIVSPGPLATVQDGGRHGYTALGVPRSGAFDRPAFRTANALVGNDRDAPVLELVFGGLHLRAVRAVTMALTGAHCPGADFGRALTLPAGAELRLGVPLRGLRSYLAVRGGVEIEPQLGSRATDTLSGIGPAPLAAGDRLATGRPECAVGEVSAALVPPPPGPVSGRVSLRLGPRDDWFTAAALRTFLTTTWRVRAECDRVGVRLDGPSLDRARVGELPSEAVLPGAVQVPGDGRPLIFGPDAPTTGGYPVIGVVAGLHQVAQLRPGDEVRFDVLR